MSKVQRQTHGGEARHVPVHWEKHINSQEPDPFLKQSLGSMDIELKIIF